MSRSKSTTVGQTAAQEREAANKLAESARPRSPFHPDTLPIRVPEVPTTPVVVTQNRDTVPGGLQEVGPALSPYPRLLSVTFRAPISFDYASLQVQNVNMSSEFYAGTYRRLAFEECCGRLMIVLERKNAHSKSGWKVFRIPMEFIATFTTYDDNPDLIVPVITVNEQAKPTSPEIAK